MDALLYATGVLVLVVGAIVSIALHEVGHLVPAKLAGLRVPRFSVGLGPVVFRRTRGETTYVFRLVPLMGHVAMIGMLPPRTSPAPDDGRPAGRFAQLIDDARAASLEEMGPGDEGRVFYQLSVPRKLAIMVGGPAMNLLIAIVIIAGIALAYGWPTVQKGALVASVSECVVRADVAASRTACAAGDPKTPAFAAGLKPGDRFVSIEGVPVESSRTVGEVVRPRAGQPTRVVVDRAGTRVEVTLTPVRNTVARLDAEGRPVRGADGRVETLEAGFLGVTSSTPVVVERAAVTAVPGIVGEQLAGTAGLVLRIPEKMQGVVQAAFGSADRDPNGPISLVGVGRIAGEVASARPPDGSDAWGAKLVTLLGIVASLNLALFVFNLIPLLPLDGGHAIGAVWEGIRRGVARLARRPDPGPVDVARMLPVAYAVSILVITMSVLLIYADIVKPVQLGG